MRSSGSDRGRWQGRHASCYQAHCAIILLQLTTLHCSLSVLDERPRSASFDAPCGPPPHDTTRKEENHEMPKTKKNKQVVKQKRRNRKEYGPKYDNLSENPASTKAQKEYATVRRKKGTKALGEALE